MSEFPQSPQYPQGWQPQNVPPSKLAPKNRRRWPWIVGGMVAVIGIGFGVAALLGAFTATPEQSYLRAVRSDAGLSSVPDAELLDLGQTSCTTMGSGISNYSDPQAWYQRTQDMHLTDSDRGTITDAAVKAFCPEYSFALHNP